MIKYKLVSVSLCIFLVVGIFCGCTDESIQNNDQNEQNHKDGDITFSSEEVIDGAYNPTIRYGKMFLNGSWYNYSQLEYAKEGKTHNTAYIENVLDAFMWIRNNTSQNSTFLNWWDYGGMIEGIGERETIAVYPSLSLVHSIGSYNMMDEEGKKQHIKEHEWSENETLKNIAIVLTSLNFSGENVQKILDKYGVDYILTKSYDLPIAPIFFSVAERAIEQYFIDCEEHYNLWTGGTPTDKARKTLIYKMWEDDVNISGLDLIYEFNAGGSNNPEVNTMLIRIFKVV